jgi:hypothetical protein
MSEIENSWIQSFFFHEKKLTILFSIVRALRRAGSFDFLTDAEFDKIIAVYDSLMKVKQTERAMEDVAKRENQHTQSCRGANMNAESWRHTDTPLSSVTVLYRYNTVRNDFVDLKIMIKKYKTETATGSILRTRRRTCESSFNERKQATHTALLTSSTATDQRCH